MKITPVVQRGLLGLAGIIAIVGLFLLPTNVVTNKESSQVTSSGHDEGSLDNQELQQSHASSNNAAELQRLSSLQKEFNKNVDKNKKRIFADSLARGYSSLFEFDSSIKYREIVLKLDSNAESVFLLANEMFQAIETTQPSPDKLPKIERTVELLTSIVDHDPDDVNTRVKLSVANVRLSLAQGQGPMQGILSLKELVKQYPDNVEARIYLAQFQSQVGMAPKAISNLKTALEIEPTNIKAHLMMVELLWSQDKRQDAKKHLEIIQKLNTDPVDPFIKQFVDSRIKELS